MKTINIIGAGKLGKTLGYLIVSQRLATISGVYCTQLKNTEAAIQFIGEGRPFQNIEELPNADVTFLTCPDSKIPELITQIEEKSRIIPKSIFVHCSGVLSSEVFAPLKTKHIFSASVHPMKSFAKPDIAITNFHGTYCAMEGDIEALSILDPIFKALGSITLIINKEKKAIYHAAGVFASNYLITLANEATQCLIESDIEENIALDIVLNLMQGTISNLKLTKSPHEALTGPLKRNDLPTIQAHLESLNINQKILYSTLGKATVSLTSHDKQSKSAIEKTLTIES